MLWAARSLCRESAVIAYRPVRFALVGLFGAGVHLLVFQLLYGLVLTALAPEPRLLVANTLAIAVTIFSNFILHGAWTWGDRQVPAGRVAWARRLLRFYLASGVAVAVQLLVSFLLFSLWLANRAWEVSGIDLGALLAVACGIVCAMLINFAAGHLWVFRQ